MSLNLKSSTKIFLKLQKLGHIAEIQFGPYIKEAQKVGKIKYLMAGHFDKYNQFTNFERTFIETNEKTKRFLLQENDVILTGKGKRLFAWAYDPQIGKAMPSSLFYLLRPKNKHIIGQYLAHYLNSEKMLYKLKLIGSGSSLPSIPKKELMELEVLVPTLKEQQKFIEMAQILDRDIILTENLLENKKMLKRGLLNDMIETIDKQLKSTKTDK